jgi:uncharacterized protein involved in exopolysaccharide biosynthesis
MNLQKQNSDKIQEDAINLVGLFSSLWNGRKFILKTTILFVFFGLLLSFIIPKEYTATTVMVPQISDPKSKLGNLSGLAAMAGFTLNAGDESEITPKIYPQIISSAPFQLEIMNTLVKFKDLDKPITLFDYFTEVKHSNSFVKYTVGLPWVILKTLKGNKGEILPQTNDSLIQFSEKQIEVQEVIKKIFNLTVNENDGYVALSCSLPEPVAAAQLTHKAQLLLKRYITEFKIEKSLADEKFIQDRFNEAESNYEKIQEELAVFRDRNKNVSTAVAKTEEERLNSKFTLISGVYSELAKKLEQAKIKVKEETPIFTIVQPVMVPSKKSKPNRPMILGVTLLLGIFIGAVIVTFKEFLLEVKEVWMQQHAGTKTKEFHLKEK